MLRLRFLLVSTGGASNWLLYEESSYSEQEGSILRYVIYEVNALFSFFNFHVKERSCVTERPLYGAFFIANTKLLVISSLYQNQLYPGRYHSTVGKRRVGCALSTRRFEMLGDDIVSLIPLA